jgi:hypothetical protein
MNQWLINMTSMTSLQFPGKPDTREFCGWQVPDNVCWLPIVQNRTAELSSSSLS